MKYLDDSFYSSRDFYSNSQMEFSLIKTIKMNDLQTLKKNLPRPNYETTLKEKGFKFRSKGSELDRSKSRSQVIESLSVSKDKLLPIRTNLEKLVNKKPKGALKRSFRAANNSMKRKKNQKIISDQILKSIIKKKAKKENLSIKGKKVTEQVQSFQKQIDRKMKVANLSFDCKRDKSEPRSRKDISLRQQESSFSTKQRRRMIDYNIRSKIFPKVSGKILLEKKQKGFLSRKNGRQLESVDSLLNSKLSRNFFNL